MKNFDSALNKLTKNVLISTLTIPSITIVILILLLFSDGFFVIGLSVLTPVTVFMLYVDQKFYRDVKNTNDRIIELYKTDPKQCTRLMSNTLGMVDREYREIISFVSPRQYLSMTTFIYATKQADLYTKIIRYLEGDM